jgi:hypothetical protein
MFQKFIYTLIYNIVNIFQEPLKPFYVLISFKRIFKSSFHTQVPMIVALISFNFFIP